MAITNCCCGGICNGCQSDPAPNCIGVTIEGVTLCKSCVFMPNTGYGKVEAVDTINGYYPCTKLSVPSNNAFSCTWIYQIPPIRFLGSSTINCLDTTLINPLTHLAVRAYKDNGANITAPNPSSFPYPNPYYGRLIVFLATSIADATGTNSGTGEGGGWGPIWAYKVVANGFRNCNTATLPNWNGLSVVCGDTVSLSPAYFAPYGIQSSGGNGKGVAGTGGTITVDFSGCCAGGTSLSNCNTSVSTYSVDLSAIPTINICGCIVASPCSPSVTTMNVTYTSGCSWTSTTQCVGGATCLISIFRIADTKATSGFGWKMQFLFDGVGSVIFLKTCGDTPAGTYYQSSPAGWSGCYINSSFLPICNWPLSITVS